MDLVSSCSTGTLSVSFYGNLISFCISIMEIMESVFWNLESGIMKIFVTSGLICVCDNVSFVILFILFADCLSFDGVCACACACVLLD